MSSFLFGKWILGTSPCSLHSRKQTFLWWPFCDRDYNMLSKFLWSQSAPNIFLNILKWQALIPQTLASTWLNTATTVLSRWCYISKVLNMPTTTFWGVLFDLTFWFCDWSLEEGSNFTNREFFSLVQLQSKWYPLQMPNLLPKTIGCPYCNYWKELQDADFTNLFSTLTVA